MSVQISMRAGLKPMRTYVMDYRDCQYTGYFFRLIANLDSKFGENPVLESSTSRTRTNSIYFVVLPYPSSLNLARLSSTSYYFRMLTH